MTQLKVVTWNAESMFAPALHRSSEGSKFESRRTRRASTKEAVAVIQSLDADIITIPEFGIVGELPDSARQELSSMGYSLHEFAYDDEYKPPIQMAILTKLPVISTNIYRLGSHRTVGSIVVKVGEQQLRVVVIHLDDKSEDTRLQEVNDLLSAINNQPNHLLIMGDFNAMHRDDWFAVIVRSSPFKAMIRLFPAGHVRYVLTRLSEMGIGSVIAEIEASQNLHQLDPGLHRTISAKQHGLEWVPAFRLAKIDWIFASRNIRTNSYKIYKDVGSDHRPVVAILSIT